MRPSSHTPVVNKVVKNVVAPKVVAVSDAVPGRVATVARVARVARVATHIADVSQRKASEIPATAEVRKGEERDEKTSVVSE